MSQNLNRFKVTEIELFYSNRRSIRDIPQVTTANMAYRVFFDHWDQNKRAFHGSLVQ